MDRGAKQAGVKRIRIHDVRHSHVAHLIELGFSPIEIAERMGHESISVTFNYSHLYPSKQKMLAEKLNGERGLDAENPFSLPDGGGEEKVDSDGCFGSGADMDGNEHRGEDVSAGRRKKQQERGR